MMNPASETNHDQINRGPDMQFPGSSQSLAGLEMVTILALLQQRPTTSEEILKQAQLFFAFAQFEPALILLADLPDSAEAGTLRRACYTSLARLSLETGDLVRAEWASEQNLREEESAFESWAIRGEVASLRGDDASSLDFFNRALDALPRDYATTTAQTLETNRLLYLRVSAMVRLRRYEEAFDHWSAVVKRSPDNSDLWYLGALCLVQLGRANEALPLCNRAIEIDPRHIDAGKLKRQIDESRGR